MIMGIGTDIVRVARMAENLQRFGMRFAEKILSAHEFADFQHHKYQANFLAKRFAAKEAFYKALGTGVSQGMTLKQVGVHHEANGKPVLVCAGKALEMITTRGVQHLHLSLSDEREYATAMVVLEG